MTIRASEQDGSYPRPQLMRPQWQSLDGPWQFGFDDEDRGRSDHWFRDTDLPQTITVPFPFEAAASGIGDHDFHPVVWYRRTFGIEGEQSESRRHLLHFGAVDHSADVWVDGQHVGAHRGGQTAFCLDITDALDSGAEHVVVVRAVDDPQSTELPRGKQDWRREPHAIWYRRSTGIWKSVWLESVPAQHIVALDWSTRLDQGAVDLDLRLSRAPEPGTEIEVVLRHVDEVLARTRLGADQTHLSTTLFPSALRQAQEAPQLRWSPENPVLIDAEVRVREAGTGTDTGGAVDEVFSYLGLRSVDVDGAVFALNGRPYFMRSVLQQGYWPDSQLTAPTTDGYREEVELIKELGFNAARIHQKTEDSRFLYWADRLGLMIWAETAAAYEFSPAAVSALTTEWLEIVAQSRSHPCVVAWVPANESWGVPALTERAEQRAFLRSLADLTRALDPTRPVISNDGWEHTSSDLLTVHDYAQDDAVLRARYADQGSVQQTLTGRGPAGRRIWLDEPGGRSPATLPDLPLMITEFGGIAYAAEGTWGYSVVEDDEQFAQRLRSLFDALRASPSITGFCYTQFSDTMQESNGLVTADRKPKLPLEVLRSIVTGD